MRSNTDAGETKEKLQLQTKHAKTSDSSVESHYVRGPLQKKQPKNCAATLEQWCHDNMTNSPIWVGG